MKQILNILLIAALASACGSKNEGDKKSQLADLKKQQAELTTKIKKLEAELGANNQNQTPVKLIGLNTVTLSTFNHYIESQGTIDAEDNVLVGPKQPGFAINSIRVKSGDFVQAGQILATADASALQNQVAGLQAQLNLAATAFERQQNLWNQKIGTEFQYLQAKTQKEALEKNIAALQSQVANVNIVAPFAGVVDEIKVKVGEMVAMGFTGIRVVNSNKLNVKAKLADSYINKVKRGNKVTIHVSEINKDLESSISYAGSVVDPISRTFNVEVRLANSGLKPNMVANLKINDATIKDVVVIDENIIQNSEEGKFVFIAKREGNKIIAKRALLTTGDNYDGQIVITNGLSAGDELIVTGYQDLIGGQEVKL